MQSRFSLFALAVLAGCTAVPSEDGQPPEILLAFLDTAPRTEVRASDAPYGLGENCVERRASANASQTVLMTVRDPGGLRNYTIRAFPGSLALNSLSPRGARVETVDLTAVSQMIVVTLPAAPAPGEVQLSSVLSVEVVPADPAQAVSVLAEATDRAGNQSFTRQFDLTEPNSPIDCRGQ